MSFSIPTLRAYRINSAGVVVPADPIISVSTICASYFNVLGGNISTSTAGSSLVYTMDGSNPVYGSNGTIIPCSLGYFVNTTPANSCENQNIGVNLCSSPVTSIKVISYLNGQSSSVISSTVCKTCPGSLTAPTANQPTCPNGDSAQGCLGGAISFVFSGSAGGCAALRYTIAEGSAPADPTINSNTATPGVPIIYNGTTVGTPATPVYVKAAYFDPLCNLSSSVTTSIYGYVYP